MRTSKTVAAVLVAMPGAVPRVRARARALAFAAYYRLTDLAYRLPIVTPKRTVAGRYLSYELTNPHGRDPGLAALAALPEDAVVYDVGSHVGEYAVPLAVDTDRTIVAFEPDARSARRLRRTVERNRVGDRIELHRVALGARDEQCPFFRSTFTKMSSLERDRAEASGGAIAGVDTVTVRSLDRLLAAGLPPPEGIKIDVEGAELAVLAGAERTIDSHEPLVVVEVHDAALGEAVQDWFVGRRYAVEAVGETAIARPATPERGG